MHFSKLNLKTENITYIRNKNIVIKSDKFPLGLKLVENSFMIIKIEYLKI